VIGQNSDTGAMTLAKEGSEYRSSKRPLLADSSRPGDNRYNDGFRPEDDGDGYSNLIVVRHVVTF